MTNCTESSNLLPVNNGDGRVEMPQLQHIKFTVDETPYCVWDWDLRQLNIDYLNSIDPRYFRHLAEIYEPSLEGERRQYASIKGS